MKKLVKTIRKYLNDRGRVSKVWYDENENCIMVKEPERIQWLSKNFIESTLLFNPVMEDSEFVKKLLSD